MWRFWLACAMAWGCSEGTIQETDGGPEGGLSGEVRGGDGGKAGAPPDAGAGPIDDDAGAACVPGTRLGLCTVCGSGGAREVAADDDLCGAIDCGAVSYERTEEEGAVVCFATGRTGAGGRCGGLGVCLSPDAYCVDEAREEVARVEAGGCQRLEGCTGETGPEVQSAPPGTACNRFGSCGGGACSVGPECARFVDAARFCRTGEANGQTFCEFLVDPPGDRRETCAGFCQTYGAVCLQAWSERDDSCQHDDESSCDEDHEDHICRCAAGP